MDRPSKVAHLELAGAADEDVLRLDVTVDYVFRVAVRQRTAQLSNVLKSNVSRLHNSDFEFAAAM